MMKNILVGTAIVLVIVGGASVFLTVMGIWFTGLCLAEVGS